MSIANHQSRHMGAAGAETRPLLRRHGTERRDSGSREALVERVVAEFREMPCLRLTGPQAQRLFGLRSDVSVRIVDQLVREGVLRLDPDGRYAATASG
jgi:hypothetical protein